MRSGGVLGAGAGQTPPEEPRTLGRTTHVSHRRAALPPSHRSAGGARGNLRGRQSAPRGHAPGRPRVHARAHARRLRTVMQASAARRLRAPHRRVPPRRGGGGVGRKGRGRRGGRGIREGGAATEGGSRANVRREKGANVGYSEYRDTPSTYHLSWSGTGVWIWGFHLARPRLDDQRAALVGDDHRDPWRALHHLVEYVNVSGRLIDQSACASTARTAGGLQDAPVHFSKVRRSEKALLCRGRDVPFGSEPCVEGGHVGKIVRAAAEKEAALKGAEEAGHRPMGTQ